MSERAGGVPATPVPSAPHDDRRTRWLNGLFGLDGQIAVVTGGLGRLGTEYVGTLARAGATVAVFDVAGSASDLDPLTAGGHTIRVFRVDITDRAATDNAMAQVASTMGTPTILVNNAGLGSSPAGANTENGRFEDYPEVAWDAMIDSHLKGTLFVTQAFIRQYRLGGARQTGSIINVSSTYGLVTPDQSVYEYRRVGGATYYKPVGYSVAKSGVLNFTRWLAEYGAPLGLRANTLVPGGVREAGHDPAFVAEYEKRTPLGRMANADEYNGAVLFLASRASAYMTGAMVVVDGGWTAR